MDWICVSERKPTKKGFYFIKTIDNGYYSYFNIEFDIEITDLNNTYWLDESINKKNKFKDINNELYVKFVQFINNTFNRNFNIKVANVSSINKFNNLLKYYNPSQIKTAIINAYNDEFHIKSNFKYLTPEFFTRLDKVEYWYNINPKTSHEPIHKTNISQNELFNSKS
jgi:hypothetical protein